MTKNQSSAIVIGAGIAGLAASIRLALKGLSVQVLEANAYPGGKLSEIEEKGYRFDAGPSLFTMPQYVDELFALAGKNPRDYFHYHRLPLLCKYFYEDGLVLEAHAEPEKFAQEVEAKMGEPAENILRFLQKSAEKYALTKEVFLQNSLHRLRNYFSKATGWGLLNFHKLDVFETMHAVNQRSFRDPRLVQFFDRYATYNGSNPYQTPGTMNIIPHLEFGIGAYFPQGGMYQITQSLVRLAQDLGVVFQLGCRVEEILYQGSKVDGVRYRQPDGQEKTLRADCVVSNMDIVGTYRHLLPRLKAPQRLVSQPKSSSAIIFYWGVRQSFPALTLHNIFFSQDYQAEFASMFESQWIHPDPTVYLNISAKEAPEDAPPGCENWFVMVNAPNNAGQDWDKLIAQVRRSVLKKLSRLLQTDLEALIEVEQVLDPRRIEQKTSSVQGALYGNSSNNRFAAFLRHANYSSRVKGLYFCGGSVHPGGGIPLSLLSAKIATDFIHPQ
ncbi:MAG: phytoene desaturase family protein [Microscillaceae bacterium]